MLFDVGPKIFPVHTFAPAMTIPRSIPICVLLLGALTFIGFRHDPSGVSSELSTEAKEFKADLLAAISGAHRIYVVEHSWRYDFLDDQGDSVEDPPHVEYKRIELTPAERTTYETTFAKMPDTPKTKFSLCMFEPHHTIELVGKGGSKSFIQVCFKCGDTAWDGRSVVPPDDFQKVFRNLIEPSGFQSNREWIELATKQEAEQTTGQPATSPWSKSEDGDQPQPEAEEHSR